MPLPQRLIYFSPVFWKSFRQRPHFMATHFLEHVGERVLWIDPYPNRLPRLGDLRRGGGIHNQQTPVPAGLECLSPRALPVEPLPGASGVNRLLFWTGLLARMAEFTAGGDTVIGVGRPSRLALQTLAKVPHRGSFLDAMDDFPEFYSGLSRRSMGRVESDLATRVDRVWASSTRLLQKFSERGLGDHLVPVFNAFNNDSLGPPAPRRPDPPVLGYVGTLSDWFDWDLLIKLATALPHCRVRLVGPLFTALPVALPHNVELLPPCPQEQVESHLEGFSVGLIPFLGNPLTRGVDPLKYYEYRAKGLAVISSRFGEMANRGSADGVFVADPDTDLATLGAAALAYQPRLDQLEDWRRSNDWSARFGQPGLFAAGTDTLEYGAGEL